MHKNVFRTTVAALLAASFGFSAVPASADGTGNVYGTGVVAGANAAIKAAMTRDQHQHPNQVAQVPPVKQHPIGGPAAIGLPTGLTYDVDFSLAYPYGNIGQTGKQWLPGGFDAIVGYGFDATTRFVANYYELQHYPAGFNSGTVPLYLQGFANPIGTVPLGPPSPQQILATKDRFYLFNFEKLILIKNALKGRTLPIVVTPTYVARSSHIAASPSNDDIVPIAPVPGGPPVLDVKTRTAQVDSIAFTLPILKTPKMFGTFTAAPSWLTHPNGFNQVNKAQLYQILYLEYTPTDRTKFFFEPQSSRDYLPSDRFAQHLMAYFLGASQRVGKNGFVQVVLNSGGPTNETPYGISALTCTDVTCRNAIPTVGGLKATQVQVEFGLGSPTIIQF